MLATLLGQAPPTTLAIVTSGGDRLSYQALRSAVERGAETLRNEAGVSRGQIVAVAIRDPAGALIAVLGALAAGATVLPLDVRMGSAGREQVERRARPVVVLTGASLEGTLTFEPSRFEARTVPSQAALLLYTSGSSGSPKGVLLSQEGIRANLDAILSYLPIRTYSRTAVVLPFSYSYALVGQAFVTLRAGGTLHLLQDVGFPLAQLELMAKEQVTGLSSVPTSLRLLCQAALELPVADRPPLGYIASAGSPLDQATRDAMRAAFPQARLFNQYGLTEACPRVTALADTEPAFSLGSVGRPLPGTEVFTLGPDDVPLPPDSVGELVVKSPSLMMGYLDDPAATTRAFTLGGLRSGDIGRVDAEGYVYVLGRNDGLVKCAGERVSVDEVAEVLRSAAGVRDAAVVALPDDRLGTRLIAFVEAPDDVDGVSAARGVSKALLTPAKRPHRIVQLAALPRSLNGKIDRTQLRQLAEEAEARPIDRLGASRHNERHESPREP